MIPTLSIVVPCYNEEEALPHSKNIFLDMLEKLILQQKVSADSSICFVDDGSNDQTWTLISNYQQSSSHIQGIKLSRNFGHQNALLAGLFSSEADITITIDADLQDDVTIIEAMIDRFLEGDEIVYGVRKKRAKDSFFKRISAQGFYKLMRLFGCDIIYNHADFRLMSKKAIDTLKSFTEVNLFLRGIVPLLGFRSSSVYFERSQREKGTSKYPLKKMLQFAIEGITSFSIIPLKLISLLGFIVFLFASLVGLWAIFAKMQGKAVQGWLSMLAMVSFMGGIQILSLGIIGEYIGKIYRETKKRPRFIVEQNIGFSSPNTFSNIKEMEHV